jgi:hypothetical protein
MPNAAARGASALPNRAGADDRERLPRQLEQAARRRRLPACGLLAADQCRQLAREAEHQREHVLGDVRRMVAAAVRDDDVAADEARRRDPVDAGAALVQPAQARRRGKDRVDRRRIPADRRRVGALESGRQRTVAGDDEFDVRGD